MAAPYLSLRLSAILRQSKTGLTDRQRKNCLVGAALRFQHLNIDAG